MNSFPISRFVPRKLRFRLPGQASLSDTCPVCTHTPVSPDLCKPNKALRTTLKAFLRTEEKKREKDRQCAAPPSDPAPVDVNPAESTPQNGEPTSDKVDTSVPTEAVQIPSEASGAAAPAADASTANAAESVAETAITDAEKAPQVSFRLLSSTNYNH